MVLKAKAASKAQSSAKTEEPEASPSTVKKSASSPARKRSPARPKSPARARSPARNKSPARKSPSRPLQSSTPKVQTITARSPIKRSPSRKSPPRTTVPTSSESYFSEKVLRPRRPQTLVDADTDSDTPDFDLATHVEKPQAAVRGRARRLEVQVEKINVKNIRPEPSNFEVLRRITRNSHSREIERVVHLKHFDKVAKKLGELSDDDDVLAVSESVDKTLIPISEFGGLWGALLIIFGFPAFVAALLISCNQYQCSFTKLPDYRKYLSVWTYFDLISVLGFFGYATILALLSALPFGGKRVAGVAPNQSKFLYTMNGFFSFIILILIAVGLEARGIPLTDFIGKHLFHILIASTLFGIVLSTYAYIRSFYVPFSALNVHVVGKNKIYGFFMGREINPRLFGVLDLKIYAYRLAIIGALLLDFAFVYKGKLWAYSGSSDLKSLNFNPTLIVLTLIRSIYYLDIISHETGTVTTFDIQYEGFGYLAAVSAVLYPFLTSLIIKYVVDYNVQLAIWKLVLINILFIFGYILFRGSNNQKDAFRKNPYNPTLSHLETIPTVKGKKLICSGFWGVVRHPNYLGDILINLSFVPFVALAPPVLGVASVVFFLVHRSLRDNVRCKQKYGAAWDRYCNKVKYVLLPKVY